MTARSAHFTWTPARHRRSTRLRAVTAIPENPFPASTFSGAYVYLSVTPHANEAACAARPRRRKIRHVRRSPASVYPWPRRAAPICVTDRDEIYTTLHHGACYRFDLAMNNFCGGEVSSVKDMTEQELENVRKRMESILAYGALRPQVEAMHSAGFLLRRGLESPDSMTDSGCEAYSAQEPS